MAESVPAIVLDCRATPAALTRCVVPAGMVWVALRPDRALGVVLPDDPRDSARWEPELQAANPGTLVIDVSPGWVAFALPGHTAPRPSVPWAGEVAGVPAVVLPVDGGTTILAEASYARYLSGQLSRGVPALPPGAPEPDSADALA